MPQSNGTQANMTTGPSIMGMARSYLPLSTLMTSIAAADLLTGFTPGYNFLIRDMFWIQNAPVTTAAKAATLTPKISGVACTGGVVALTSALCTPMGAVIKGTDITALNQGSDTDTISVVGSAVTAFVEGSGTLYLEIQNLDIPL